MSYVATRGFGDAASTARDVQIGGSLAASAATAVVGSIAASGGTIAGLAASTLVPVVGPVIAAAVMGLQLLIQNSGCGITCVETSQWANQAADKLQTILDGYFALPAPRTDAQKAVAVAAFQSVWQTLVAQCSQPGTGNAGVRCISDRQAGACTWKQKYAPVYPGEPNIGECWNWWNGYLGPIQQDVTVPDPVATAAADVSSTVSSIFSPSTASGGTNWLPLALLGGLLIYGAVN